MKFLIVILAIFLVGCCAQQETTQQVQTTTEIVFVPEILVDTVWAKVPVPNEAANVVFSDVDGWLAELATKDAQARYYQQRLAKMQKVYETEYTSPSQDKVWIKFDMMSRPYFSFKDQRAPIVDKDTSTTINTTVQYTPSFFDILKWIGVGIAIAGFVVVVIYAVRFFRGLR